MASGIGISGGVSDIFAGIGDLSEASDYNTAAKYAEQNAAITKESTRIQQSQEQRKVCQVAGLESAGYGAGNLSANTDVLRGTMQQGALQHQIIGLQGAVTANSFEEQATAYKGQAASATAAGAGNIAGGILGIFGL